MMLMSIMVVGMISMMIGHDVEVDGDRSLF